MLPHLSITMVGRTLALSFTPSSHGSGRRLEKRRNDGERRGWMLLDDRNCPQSANCLRVLNRDASPDNHGR